MDITPWFWLKSIFTSQCLYSKLSTITQQDGLLLVFLQNSTVSCDRRPNSRVNISFGWSLILYKFISYEHGVYPFLFNRILPSESVSPSWQVIAISSSYLHGKHVNLLSRLIIEWIFSSLVRSIYLAVMWPVTHSSQSQ